ncbi:hypothetical protein NQ315_012957 [Exocentrus adspersus]|uniref:DDE Tnp4 domain-containing protein n=1 Tax=Exocentrus adspersus TaxID=1586481 RepID=A0AAV8VRV8_9CUCU|nr:hypothetical protein NQ315_012957 [Exocentrus adspersus]
MAAKAEEELINDITDDEDFIELVLIEAFPRVPRNFRYRITHFTEWTDKEFMQRFRLSKDTLMLLVGMCREDSVCLKNELRARIENGEFGNDSVLLDDGGYANRDYLITPLRNPNTPAEHLFNENCRLPVLSIGIRINIDKVESIIVACAVLHNMAREIGEPELEVGVDVDDGILANNFSEDTIDNVGINMNNLVRNNFFKIFYNYIVTRM